MATRREDVYYKKTVAFNFWRHHLQFKTSQELFSSDDIDMGTKFLLRTIAEADYGRFQKILDLGCGYGPLGLTLKSLNDGSILHMVDRDALAVEYSLQNAKLNGFSDVEVYGSLGYDDVTRDNFDLIVSNIPGKSGELAITSFIQEAAFYLKPDGMVAIVIVSPLDGLVSGVISRTPGIDVVLKRSRAGHIVYHYRLKGGPAKKQTESALERGIYQRNVTGFRFQDIEYSMRVAYGLTEFDKLSYSTQMIMNALHNYKKSEIQNTVFVNPGQGHLPVFVRKLLPSQNIILFDRDLLALRYSALNLRLNGFAKGNLECHHQVGVGPMGGKKADIVIIMLREEGLAVDSLLVNQSVDLLSEDGVMLIAGHSTAVTRLVDILRKEKRLSIRGRERKKGFSSLVLRHML